MSNELTQALQSLFVVALVAALAPVIVGSRPAAARPSGRRAHRRRRDRRPTGPQSG